MVKGKLEVISQKVGTFEKITLGIDGNPVFVALQKKKTKYASVVWDVNPDNDKEYYLRQLSEFYQALRDGNFKQRESKYFSPIIMLAYDSKEAEVPLEHLVGEPPKLLEHIHFTDLRFLRINTPYADLMMQRGIGAKSRVGPWKPEDGALTVITHQDLSKVVSKLIAETSRYPITAEQIEQVLSEKVYNIFK